MLFPGGVLGIEKQAAGNRPKHPADAVARLREIDAGGRVLPWTEHSRVWVGNGFKKGEAGRNQANPQQKGPKGRNMRRRDKPKAAQATNRRPAMIPPLYPSLMASQPAGNDIRK